MEIVTYLLSSCMIRSVSSYGYLTGNHPSCLTRSEIQKRWSFFVVFVIFIFLNIDNIWKVNISVQSDTSGRREPSNK